MRSLVKFFLEPSSRLRIRSTCPTFVLAHGLREAPLQTFSCKIRRHCQNYTCFHCCCSVAGWRTPVSWTVDPNGRHDLQCGLSALFSEAQVLEFFGPVKHEGLEVAFTSSYHVNVYDHCLFSKTPLSVTSTQLGIRASRPFEFVDLIPSC